MKASQLPQRLTIEVDQKLDIDKGIRENCAACPLARATNRALRKLGFLNSFASVAAGLSVCARRSGRTQQRYSYPTSAHVAMQTYDQTGVMVPFTFEAVAYAPRSWE